MPVTGEFMDLRSVTMVDYVPQKRIESKRFVLVDDDCLIVGNSRYSLKPRQTSKPLPEKVCPIELEYYKKAAERFNADNPKLAQKYKLNEDLDPVPIEHEIEDNNRSRYMLDYCPRDLPFMSVNLTLHAHAVQSLHLPDDIYIPATTQRNSYRVPEASFYEKSDYLTAPKEDNSFRDEQRKTLRVKTGETTYDVGHNMLANVILKEQPFGKPRKEPRYGKWKTPYQYTYYV